MQAMNTAATNYRPNYHHEIDKALSVLRGSIVEDYLQVEEIHDFINSIVSTLCTRTFRPDHTGICYHICPDEDEIRINRVDFSSDGFVEIILYSFLLADYFDSDPDFSRLVVIVNSDWTIRHIFYVADC